MRFYSSSPRLMLSDSQMVRAFQCKWKTIVSAGLLFHGVHFRRQKGNSLISSNDFEAKLKKLKGNEQLQCQYQVYTIKKSKNVWHVWLNFSCNSSICVLSNAMFDLNVPKIVSLTYFRLLTFLIHPNVFEYIDWYITETISDVQWHVLCGDVSFEFMTFISFIRRT